MIKLNHLIKKELIYEGLISSVNIDKSVEMLQKWSGSDKKFDVFAKSDKIQLNFKENLDERELLHLLKLINKLGWFTSACLIFASSVSWKKFDYYDFVKNDMHKRWLSFQLEAKFDLELDPHSFNTLYHVSPTIYRDKILKIGIVPKSKEKISSHPERIYLADNEDDINILAFQFSRRTPDLKLSLFKIDFDEVRKHNPSIRLFNDPNFTGGFYTLSNIPPRFITWEGEMDI